MSSRDMRALYEATFAQPLPPDLGEPDPWAALPSYTWTTIAPFEFVVQGDQRARHGGTMALFANLVRVEQISRAGNHYFAHVDPDGGAPAEIWLAEPAAGWRYTRLTHSRASLDEALAVAEELLFSEAFDAIADRAALASADLEARAELEPILERVAALEGRVAHCSEPSLAALYDAFARFAPPRAGGSALASRTRAGHYVERARWIVELLASGAPGPLTAEPEPAPERELDAVLADPGFGHSPPDALYWLLCSFFHAERDALAAVLARCASSRSPMVASAASVIARAERGPTPLGSIPDLCGLRDAYLAARRGAA
ncbi:MAG: hypothetical protein U1F43_16095 [Myxococcota bacterium]